jgi:hypothetical protein
VTPKALRLSAAGAEFQHAFPARSVTVIELSR